jgi:UDP-3-O-[3-hydroxymyristoyl] glucosamine N-acyltransferase
LFCARLQQQCKRALHLRSARAVRARSLNVFAAAHNTNTHQPNQTVPKLMPVLNAELKLPKVAKNAWIAPSAQVSGDVKLGDSASVWYNATVRGDAQPVTIGAFSNLQDGACVGSLRPGGGGTRVGSHVSVGHNAVLQACTVGDRSLIGMNAVLADGVTVRVVSFCFVHQCRLLFVCLFFLR